MVTVSLYARVSSGKQAQEDTIASQIAAIENKISADGHKLLSEYRFIDNGYSGSDIIRPSLEKLRDQIVEGNIDKVYIHSPDRLARKYVHQMLLFDEFKKLGVETIFLNCQINDNPESQLLLQMQGMIAEYERAKIMERSRRGKIHAANKGNINVMGGAPYGYRYINKHIGGGQAFFEINEEEAEIVRKMFFWVGRERVSTKEVCRRLSAMSVITRKGKKYWDRTVVCRLLQNPAYKGQAAFGKKKLGAKLKHVRPQKGSCEQPKNNYSTFRTDKKDWIYIPVPNIITKDLFDIVQEQLAENGKIARTREKGARYLLQGLVVCKSCHYAYYGSPVRNKREEKIDQYAYYRCTGRDSYRFGGNKICDNKRIRTDVLEAAVWEEVKHLLKDPNRILEEYKRRLSEIKKSPLDQKSDLLEKKEVQLNCGIARLIDGYTQGYINEEEFKPRIKAMKQTLQTIEEQKKKIFDQKRFEQDLTLVVTNLEEFSSSVNLSLDNADWLTKRDIIRTLVKRIEIDHEDVNIVFRVKELPDSFTYSGKADKSLLQYCCRGRESVRVPANDVLHIYKPLRPGQIRGEPWLSNILLKLYELDQYDDAELVRKKTAAMFAGFITRLDPEANIMGEGESNEQGVALSGLEPGTMQLLDPGEDIKFSEPSDVGGSYEAFMRQQLRAIAIGTGITYEQLTGDLTGVNYSSIRAGLIEFRRRCAMLQHNIIVFQFCRPVWSRWLELATLSGELSTTDNQIFKDVKWIPQGFDWVDPLKDQQAQQMAVRNGFKSRAEVVSEMGYDVEEIDQEIAEDQRRASELGLSFDSDVTANQEVI